MEKYKDKTLPVKERIADLLSKMTLEEKARQIDQYSPTDLTCEDSKTGERVVDYDKLKEMGDTTGFAQVMAAVSDFEKGNMRLSAVLAAMNIPQ